MIGDEVMSFGFRLLELVHVELILIPRLDLLGIGQVYFFFFFLLPYSDEGS